MLSKEYLTDKRMNQSTLKLILDGVEEFKHAVDNPRKPSDSQNLGSAVHVLILEPHRHKVIAKLPKIDGKTREGKIFNFLMAGKGPDYFRVSSANVKKQELGLFYEVDTEEHEFMLKMGEEYGHVFTKPQDFIILDEVEYVQAHRMAEAAFKNEHTRHLLRASRHFEKVHHFTYMGIDFKCQLDTQGDNFIGDLKTTIVKNDDYLIERELRKYRYLFQAAVYSKVFGVQVPDYYVFFVRSEAPYAVFPIKLSPRLLKVGNDEVDDACNIYNYCLKNNPNFIANNRLREI